MKSRWSRSDAEKMISRFGKRWGEALSLRTYSARLLGSERTLVLHGGGNTSVKAEFRTLPGEAVPAIFVKASGYDLAGIEPEGHPALDLTYLKKLRGLEELSDDAMVSEIRSHLLRDPSPTPSIETLAHAFLPHRYLDHTHADAVLALTNQPHGEEIVREALGEEVLLLDYVKPGFGLAKASAEALDRQPGARGMVWMRHGIVTWGETAQDSYEAMIELVSRAEAHLKKKAGAAVAVAHPTPVETAKERWLQVAPALRGLLAEAVPEADAPYRRVILTPLISREVLDFLDSAGARELARTPPLTADHLIRTKPLPLWVEDLSFGSPLRLKEQLSQAVLAYRNEYGGYLERNASRMSPGVSPQDSSPRVVLIPGLGAACAGPDSREAGICRDITRQNLSVKARVGAMGRYQGLEEADLFAMEYYTLQQAKLKPAERPLASQTAMVTGAAGAIGSGVSRALLEAGCHVAVTDLPGEPLDRLEEELASGFPGQVCSAPLDVTDEASVRRGFEAVTAVWGGVDAVVINAGLALVSSLEEMRMEAFRRLEEVNVEGTLRMLSEAARHLRFQGTGGDVVLISTKNVFAPGAQFGAYSATKAAAHQLARIASLELAEIGVRVNMVAPDAVFSEGERKSGLWAEVGPGRMKARGLDEAELEEYYRNRNLLKTKVTARHVANAVLFFLRRETPTTGATIPVDGGLPDATPR